MLTSIHTIIFNAKRFVRTKTTSLILDDVEVGFEGKDVLFCVKTLANLLGLGAFSEISFGAKTDHGSTLPLCFKQPGGAFVIALLFQAALIRRPVLRKTLFFDPLLAVTGTRLRREPVMEIGIKFMSLGWRNDGLKRWPGQCHVQ